MIVLDKIRKVSLRHFLKPTGRGKSFSGWKFENPKSSNFVTPTMVKAIFKGRKLLTNFCHGNPQKPIFTAKTSSSFFN